MCKILKKDSSEARERTSGSLIDGTGYKYLGYLGVSILRSGQSVIDLLSGCLRYRDRQSNEYETFSTSCLSENRKGNENPWFF